MASEPGCKIERRDSTAGVRIKMSGLLNETFDRAALSGLDDRVVIVDLEGLERITSYGVRLWRTAWSELAPRYLAFQNVHPLLMAQFNAVHRFGGSGEVVSLYLPYLCPECDGYEERLLDLRTEHAEVQAFRAPAVKCRACGQASEFDDVPKSYFHHVAAAPRPQPPPEAELLLSGATPFMLSSDPAEGVTALWASGAVDKAVNVRRVAEGLEGPVLLEAQSVEEADAEGLLRMVPLWSYPQLYLARVSPPLLAALERQPELISRLNILSVVRSPPCIGCHRQGTVEVAVPPAAGPVSPARCLACKAVQPDLEPTRRAPASAAPVPAAVTAYLAGHASLAPSGPGAGGERLGRYEILERLGTGGMAEVYLAKQVGLGGFSKRVVVKKILPHHSRDQAFVEMFLQEARLAARISHRNVVNTLDVGSTRDGYYIALEHVDGKDLSQLLHLCRKIPALPPLGVAVRIGMEICAGLNAAHSARDENDRPTPILHRDVSPHNVLISLAGEVKLADFGIATAEDVPETPKDPETLSGKTAYLSPEQINNPQLREPRSDIYACGLVLYECLTLQHPFKRSTEAATLLAILRQRSAPPSSARPGCPEALDAIVGKMLAPLSERFASAQEVSLRLEELLMQQGAALGDSDIGRWVAEVVSAAGPDALGASPLEPTQQAGEHEKTPTVSFRVAK